VTRPASQARTTVIHGCEDAMAKKAKKDKKDKKDKKSKAKKK
jgi:hypothetical protein